MVGGFAQRPSGMVAASHTARAAHEPPVQTACARSRIGGKGSACGMPPVRDYAHNVAHTSVLFG
jgi:hypothetical protein